MKNNAYLYGEDVEVPEIPAEVIVRRIELLKEHLEELLEIDYKTRDLERIRHVVKAISFWEKLSMGEN